MNSLDSNQIKIFINLEIIGEEDKYRKIIFIFKKILIFFLCNLVQSLGATTNFRQRNFW